MSEKREDLVEKVKSKESSLNIENEMVIQSTSGGDTNKGDKAKIKEKMEVDEETVFSEKPNENEKMSEESKTCQQSKSSEETLTNEELKTSENKKIEVKQDSDDSKVIEVTRMIEKTKVSEEREISEGIKLDETIEMCKETFVGEEMDSGETTKLSKKSKEQENKTTNMTSKLRENKKEKERELKNPFEDFDDKLEIYIREEKKLAPGIEGALKENVFILLKTLEKYLVTDVDWQDTTVYTGTAGYALLYLRIHDSGLLPEDAPGEFLRKGLSYVQPVLPLMRRRRSCSFLCGTGGVLTVAAALYQRKGQEREAQDLQQRLHNLANHMCTYQLEFPNELMYGRAGYLQTLLFCKKYIPQEEKQNVFLDWNIREVSKYIIDLGHYIAKEKSMHAQSPLYFEWHGKAHLGAAHGVAGILCVLLEAEEYISEENMEYYVKPTVEYVLKQQFKSGNFPSSLENHRDKLVHWCHGASGVILLLIKAYEVFKEEKYLEAAREAAECIWKRGITRKGYGICHGVSGNGYAFIHMFQLTREIKYLYRAVKFAEWCFDFGKHGCKTPDRPLSLFEGFAGMVYYLLDLLQPEKATFPGF